MLWGKNLLEYVDTKKILPCPKCGSVNVTVEEHNLSRKSISFRCNVCGAGDHFDGVSADDG